MTPPEGPYWEAAAFFRSWTGPFASAVEAARKGEKEAAELTSLVARLGGKLPAAPSADGAEVPDAAAAEVDPDTALAGLRARVEDLQRFVDLRTRRAHVEEWLGRATSDGPLAAWADEARRVLAEVDASVADASPEAIREGRDRVEALLKGVEAAKDELQARVSTNRDAGTSAMSAYDEVVRLVKQDLANLDPKVRELAAKREDEDFRGASTAVVLTFALAGVGLAVVAGLGGLGQMWPMLAGLSLGLGGLLAGSVRFALRARASTREGADLLQQVRALRDDAELAYAEVLKDLRELQRETKVLATQVRELKSAAPLADHGASLAAAVSPTDNTGLAKLLPVAEAVGRPNPAALPAAAGSLLLVLLVAAGLVATRPSHVLVGPPAAQQPSAAHASPGAPDGTVASGAGAGAEGAPAAGAAAGAPAAGAAAGAPAAGAAAGAPAAGAAAGAPAVHTSASAAAGSAIGSPTAEPAAFRSGPWSGTSGTWALSGTLTLEGTAVRGRLDLAGPEGAQACAVSGKLNGTSLTLTTKGCAAKIKFDGQVTDGTTVRGQARSTTVFQGKELPALDAWAMFAD